MRGLVKRNIAIANSVVGILEVFVGTSLAICGFIVLGLYRNLSGVGLWAGLPLIACGLLTLVLLGTRHRHAAFAVLLCSIGALCLCVGHTVKTWRDSDDWDKAKTDVDNRACYDRVDQCICTTTHLKEFFAQRCGLYTFGFELYWGMTGLGLAAILVSVIGSILAAVASCSEGDPMTKYNEQNRYTTQVHDYPESGKRFEYYVSD